MTFRSPTLATLVLSCATGAVAMESQAVGPRATAMGGTGVAATDDYVAQFYNPAAFGFFSYGGADGQRVPVDNNDLQRKDWGFGLDATVGAHVVGNLGQYLNDVLKIDVNKLETLGSAGAVDQQTLTDAVNALAALSQFDQANDAVLVDVNAGAGLRIKHVGIGFRTYGQAIGKIQDLDTTHIGVALPTGVNLTDAINQVNTSAPVGYTPQILTAAQQTSIKDALRSASNAQGTGTPSDADLNAAVAKIDYSIGQAGVDGQVVQGVVDQFTTFANSSSAVGGLAFGDNGTKLRIVGLTAAEFPVSYGFAFDDHWSIGGSVKYMVGRVYASDIPLFNSGDKKFRDYLDDTRNDYVQSSTVGFDLGVMGRWNMVQAGLTARNINAPSFKAPAGFDKQTLDPQAALGLAFIPTATVTLAADADLLTSDSVLPGRSYRHLGAGIEWDAFRCLALRAGVTKNIAESSDPVLYTAGLGLNLWLLRIDLAAQATPDTVNYDGHDVPKEARVSLALATDW